MKTPHHIRRPGSRRPPARRALSPASGPRQSRSSCKHHPGKILDHETQTDEEGPTPAAACVEFDAHSRSRRRWPTPGGRLAFVKGHLRTQGGLLGPLEVTVGRREKRWAALFTCLTTRAVHMERPLSADSMIMALRRFMARRGQPDTLYSDHGTNFVGAARTLPSSPGDRRANVRRGDDSGDTMAAHTPTRPAYGRKLGTPGQVHKGGFERHTHHQSPKDEVHTRC
ncbi:hypothetical protein EVAR_89650_1 [Eumeta japonica]|uniref:Integrase catalytic domain-containing protein n=1 Tax=Eumeta variegata TaxID=151549 RepID=A0A4C1Z7S0_EUMVA|nr:hypothetical protein EVAR_89650_1 [Eumeta japonica]